MVTSDQLIAELESSTSLQPMTEGVDTLIVAETPVGVKIAFADIVGFPERLVAITPVKA